MKHTTILSLFLTLCALAYGQTDPANPAPPAPAHHDFTFLVGSSYNPSGAPKATLDLGASYALGEKDSIALQVAASFHRDPVTNLPSRLSAVYRPEYVRQVALINGKIPIYTIAGIGAEMKAVDPTTLITQIIPTVKSILTGGGTNLGYNGDVGLGTRFVVFKHLDLRPAVRGSKSSVGDTTYSVGVQLAFKMSVDN
jgi:hypothetical protein